MGFFEIIEKSDYWFVLRLVYNEYLNPTGFPLKLFLKDTIVLCHQNLPVPGEWFSSLLINNKVQIKDFVLVIFIKKLFWSFLNERWCYKLLIGIFLYRQRFCEKIQCYSLTYIFGFILMFSLFLNISLYVCDTQTHPLRICHSVDFKKLDRIKGCFVSSYCADGISH